MSQNELILEAVSYITTCQIEGQGNIILTSVSNSNVLTTLEAIQTEVSVSFYLLSVVQVDLPSVTVFEFELTSSSQFLIFPAPCEGLSASSNLDRALGPTPAVHTTGNTPLNLSDNDLRTTNSLESFVLIEIKDDVVESGFSNFHLNVLRQFTFVTKQRHEIGQKGVIAQLCAVVNGQLTLFLNEMEFLTSLENDVFLVHSVTLSIFLSLIVTRTHLTFSNEISQTGSLTYYVETVLYTGNKRFRFLTRSKSKCNYSKTHYKNT